MSAELTVLWGKVYVAGPGFMSDYTLINEAFRLLPQVSRCISSQEPYLSVLW